MTDAASGSDMVANNLRQAVVQQLGQIAKLLASVLTAVQSTSPSATAGSATLPANPAGFINATLPNGTPVKIPYYNP